MLSVLVESLRFCGPAIEPTLPELSTTPCAKPMMPVPPVNVPAAIGVPLNWMFVIVTPGPDERLHDAGRASAPPVAMSCVTRPATSECCGIQLDPPAAAIQAILRDARQCQDE